MMTFLDEMSAFFSKILPIVSVIVLIFLAYLFYTIIKFVKGLSSTVEEVDKSINKLQAPLRTVESLSYSIDSVHNISKKAINKSVSMVVDNYDVVKEWVSSFFDKGEDV